MADETISEKCETLYNKLNSFVASVISRDVTPKLSNLNTEVWGSDTQTGNSRIDTLNTNFDNLNSSISTMESDINNVESDVSNLQTSVNSLNTSITNIMGFTLVHSGASNQINVYSNGLFVYFTMQGTFTMSANADTNTGTIPSQYAPNVPITVATHPSSNNKLVIQDNGSLLYHNFTSSTSQTLRVGVVYPLKANLP
jgi:outer membrane murein-binding lipoprotein Lpp